MNPPPHTKNLTSPSDVGCTRPPTSWTPLPKRLHKEAKPAIHAIYDAECRADAIDQPQAFAEKFADFPKAVGKITAQLDTLLAFYDFPAEHWKHLRSTNAIESTFATVRLRTKVTKDAGSRKAALAMAYKLVDAVQTDGDESTDITWLPSSEPEPLSSTATHKKGARPTKPTPRTSRPDHDRIHKICEYLAAGPGSP